MIYFTADLHFGHQNIIRAAHRPFETAEEMDAALIKNWNDRVAADDEVYILGDLSLRGPQYTMQILRQLKGVKYLVRGNHDGFVDRSSFDCSLFQWVKEYHRLFCLGRQFILFHYPIVEWDQAHHGSFQLHGHQHSPLGQGCKACQRQGSGKQDRNDLFHFQPSMHKFFRFGCILAYPRHSDKRKAARKVRAA